MRWTWQSNFHMKYISIQHIIYFFCDVYALFFFFFGLLAFFWPSDYTCDELEKYNVVCFLLLFSSLESFNELRSSIGYLVEQIRDNWLDYFSNDAIHLSFSVTKSIHKFEIRRKSSRHTQSQYLNRQISGILPELRLKTRTHTHIGLECFLVSSDGGRIRTMWEQENNAENPIEKKAKIECLTGGLRHGMLEHVHICCDSWQIWLNGWKST